MRVGRLIAGSIVAVIGLYFIWSSYIVYQSTQYCDTHPNSCWNFPQPPGWEQENLAIGLAIAFALMAGGGYLVTSGVKPRPKQY